jgi:class 3 adenylate cyclase/tetratricopeptide (TPR) repeat protein
MRCSSCGSDNPDGLKFCNQCGAAFNAHCLQCGFDNAPGARFCGQCGAPLAAGVQVRPPIGQPIKAVERPENRSQSRAGERRHLTVLFCDLVGSTEIAARLDPEEWQETMAFYHRAAAEAITRFDGHVAKYLGDGVMAYFGYPAAHDNDAERAARAGLAILEAITRLNQHPSRPKLAARVGIDSGAVVVGAGAGTETDVFGEAPNIAARVQAAAPPDTVLISAATHRLVAGLFVVEDCGEHALKGVEQPMQLYRVVQPAGVRGRLAASAAYRGLTPFVGREDEMRMLTSRWQRVLDGEGQAVLIIGEAGIGKSRLLQQFHQQTAGTPHTWVEATAAPFYQNTPFYPVAEVLRQLVWEQSFDRLDDYLRELQNDSTLTLSRQSPSPHLSRSKAGEEQAGAGEGLKEDTDGVQAMGGKQPADERLDELQSGLVSAGLRPAEAIPLIAPLLHLPLSARYAPSSLSPELQRRRLLATLIEWLLGAARAQPLVIVIEDVHWADPSTLELIQLLLEQGATARLLLLYTARPEFHAEWPLRAHHTQITLNRLSARNVREMIAEVAARSALASETLEAVVERTSGVPLFVEELTRAVLEGENAKLTGREIPVTLHDSLMARLDRLGSAKEVLQIGSVIGGEFSYELLHAVHDISEEELQRELRRLTDADLLRVRGLAPDATYQFKHALIRDAAYEALLKSRRKELHRLVAHTLDETFPAVRETQPELLARHWTEAGEAEPAIGAWQRAGERAVERRAFREAEEHYREALGMLATLPESPARDTRELTFQIALARVLMATRGFSADEPAAAYARARMLAERSGGTLSLPVLNGSWASAVNRGDYYAAQTLADQLLGIAESMNNPAALVIAHNTQGQTRFFRGDIAGAWEHLAQAIDNFNAPDYQATPSSLGMNRVGVLSFAAWAAFSLGRLDTSLRLLHDMIRLAQRLKNPFPLVYARMVASMIYALRREPQRALEEGDQADQLGRKLGFPLQAALSRVTGGWARATLGQPRQGLAQMREAQASLAAMGYRLLITAHLYLLSEVQAEAGAIGDALASVEEGLLTNPEELVFRPELLRLRGEIRLKAQASTTETLALAEADLRAAIALALQIGAKVSELRATMSLARLLDERGHPNEARAMLAEIYNWFTDGFDTPDLKDAKSLLDKLGK